MAEVPPFLRLPTEIRLQIYEYLYVQPEGKLPIEATFPIWGPAPIWLHKLELRHGNFYAACNSTKRSFWSILQISKLVNEEVLDLLFERFLFTIFVSDREHDTESGPGPPLLGAAKDFAFWQRANRILLVNIDSHPNTLKLLPYTLGAAFRCFNSTPKDTTTFIYLRDTDRIAGSYHIDRRPQYGRQIVRSLASLSARTGLHFEVHSYTQGQAKAVKYLDAAHALAKLGFCNDESEYTSMVASQRRTPPCVVLPTETVDHGTAAEKMLGAREAGTERIMCWMSGRSRHDASRQMALERKRERLRLRKKRAEGEV